MAKSSVGRVVIVLIVFVAIGTIYLISTRAAGNTISLEAENGTLSGTAVSIADSAASGGSAVNFSNSVTPSPSPATGGWFMKGVEVYPSTTSVWERNVRAAPLSSSSATYVSYWAAHSSLDVINLAGSATGGVGQYSFATCYGTANDPVWTVTGRGRTYKMHCAPNSGSILMTSPGDSELAFIDLTQKLTVKIGDLAVTGNLCNNSTHTCAGSQLSARWWGQSGTVAGLDQQYNPTCDDCFGHRGLDVDVFGYRFDEVKAGNVPHLVKVTLPSEVNSGTQHVWPYVGTENGKTGIIPEGSRARLKQASYDRLKLSTSNAAVRTMLDQLFNYGIITADSGGNGANVKLENNGAFSWSSIGIAKNSLGIVNVTDFEFIDPNYGK